MIRFGATLAGDVLTIWLVRQEHKNAPMERIPAEFRLEDLWPSLPAEFRQALAERGAVAGARGPEPPIPGQLEIDTEEAA